MMYSFIAIPVLLATCFVIPVLCFKEEKYIPIITLFSMSLAVILSLMTIPEVMKDGVLVMQLEGWQAPYGITLSVDSFGLLIILSIITISWLTVLFSYRFIDIRKMKYYALICLLTVGLLGVVHTGDLFNMFVFYEIVGVSSYILTSYYTNKSAIEGAIKYLIIGSFGTSLILLGIGFIYASIGSVNMAYIARAASDSSKLIPFGVSLLLCGFAIKSAIFPFHAWKPDVISVTPAPVGAMFAISSTSVGIYSIIRVVYSVFAVNSVVLYSMLIGIGLLTMIVGAILAIQQDGLLRLLAYSSISQIGFVLTAFGLGHFNVMGFTASIYHLFNIVAIEALLFFSAGIIIHETGTSNMKKLGGLSRKYPLFSYIFLIGILANAGIPLLNGFSSKWLIYLASFQVSPFITIVAIVSSVLALLYGLRAYDLVFLGGSGENPRRLKTSMMIPLLVLAIVCLVFGLFPGAGMEISEYVYLGLQDRLFVAGVIS